MKISYISSPLNFRTYITELKDRNPFHFSSKFAIIEHINKFQEVLLLW